MKREIKEYFLFMIFLTVLALGIQFLLPFPFGLIVAITIYALSPKITKIVMGKRLEKAGVYTMGNLPKTTIQKYCMACGLKCKDSTCNRCGSHRFTMR